MCSRNRWGIKNNIVLLLSLPLLFCCGCDTASTSLENANTSSLNEVMVDETIAEVRRINSSSDFGPYSLLEAVSEGNRTPDGPVNTTEPINLASYNYPLADDSFKITYIQFEIAEYNLLGITVGTHIDDAVGILIEDGYSEAPDSVPSYFQSSAEKFVANKYDVWITLTLSDDKVETVSISVFDPSIINSQSDVVAQ